jgi:hypothetical protein
MVAKFILRHIYKKKFPFFSAVSSEFAVRVYRKCSSKMQYTVTRLDVNFRYPDRMS